MFIMFVFILKFSTKHSLLQTSDVNRDFTFKDKDQTLKDKDQTYKDQIPKDQTFKDKD